MSTQERPRDHESERIVCVGLITIGGGALAEVSAVLRAEDMDHPGWRAVMNAAIAADRGGEPVDIATVQAHIKLAEETNRIAMSLGPEALREANRARVSMEQVRYHARNIAAHAARRRFIAGADRLRDLAYEHLDVDALTAEALKVVRDAQIPSGVRRVQGKALVKAAMKRLDARAQNPGAVTGIRTGIEILDQLTGGLQPGHLITMAGGTSAGKSALATQIALTGNVHSLIFSLEMTKEEVIDRMLVQESRLDGMRFQAGQLTRDEWIAAAGGSERIAQQMIEVSDGETFDVETIRIEILRWLATIGKPDLALVVIDYLQLIELRSVMRRGREASSREQEVSTIARMLFQIARETGAAIVALSQLNEDGHLRESKAIGMHSNEVLALEPDGEEPDTIILRLRKQRNGPKGAVRLRWLAPSMRFEQHVDQLIKRRKRGAK